ncbi:hypothetical protein B0T16DRAFT_451703 [Cercophora newfieldiana]|uniref:Uncharacterized protein n=1 Tax=Cercophora newfieldiana TaxID=92897 RepID=A0AA40CYB2_9PEZI|nr:hypothetical protein B0T16DRAFT_451703 [Cercophora newfieldiana]
MAPWQPQRSLASALCALLALTPQNVAAIPYPKDDLHAAGFGYLMPRQCNQFCGMDNQYCCSAGTQCYTSNGIAGCSADAGGGVAFYTTTWTSTGTFTSTISSVFGAATAASGDCIPPAGSDQTGCGSICCAGWQYCAYKGQCLAKDKMPGPVSSGGQAVTTQFSAPYRVTSGVPTGPTTATTGTADSATTTDGGGAVAPGGTAGGGLSPGAIAGIVIGTLAGIVLLILICACCIIRGLWHGAMAILGLGKKRKKETVVEEEYRRSSSRHSRRDNHGSWYGGGGRPSTVTSRKEKKSSGKGLLGLGAALGTLWLLLGLRKKDKKKSTKSRSDVSSSYWSDSYTATSPMIVELGAQGAVVPAEPAE